jgi:hypothetical protein
VIYELDESEGGVDFKLILEDLPAGTVTAKQMKQGGTMITKSLKAIVETGRPPLLTRCLYAMFRWMEPLMAPKRSRVENWPMR